MTFPVTIERSISVYILGSIYKKQTMTAEDLEKALWKYFHEHRLVREKRINEQLVTGSIVVDNDGYIILTPRGRLIVKINALIGRLFNLDMENILPTVKDKENEEEP
jgi:hypothetical protein